MELCSGIQAFRNSPAASMAAARFLSVLFASAFLALPAAGQLEPDAGERLRERLAESPKPHPRLYLGAEEIERMRERIGSDPLLEGVWDSIRRQADAMVDLAPVEREMVGRRLLGVSRQVVKRVSYLAFAYRMTGEERYLERAEEEMVAAAGFGDWNPDHFLDVGEMTAALAIGYDWLHGDLSPDARETIRGAIVEKGLRTSFDRAGWWVTTTNNWSQVCHGGLTLGALAVMDREPELAGRVIERALENISRPMDVYGPNGAYPEGAGYWSYGTSYNVLLIAALESALGGDFGLSGHERFMASPVYYLHVHGPTTKVFNYSDNGESSGVAPEMYWFARKLGRPEVLWMERRKLERFFATRPNPAGGGQRLLPFLPIWAGEFDGIDPPGRRDYLDEGEAPVGIHRTGWDERATYVGIKAGTPGTNHGQMDTGSFVMESDGVRWAVDLGVQNYNSLESAGINLWNMSQDSDRWTVFRLNNRSKNTLVVDDELQRVEGFAPIVSFSEGGPIPHTVVDLTEVYEGQLASVRRGVGLVGDGAVAIRDEIRAPDRSVEVRWGMVTRAEVDLVAGDRAVLRQDGEDLGLHVLADEEPELELYETAEPPREHDAPNPGTRMIGFTVRLEPGAMRTLTVLLNPGGLRESAPEIPPFEE